MTFRYDYHGTWKGHFFVKDRNEVVMPFKMLSQIDFKVNYEFNCPCRKFADLLANKGI